MNAMSVAREVIDAFRYDRRMGQLSVATQTVFAAVLIGGVVADIALAWMLIA